MKKATEIKYPNSANLFQFCRRVLDQKFGGVRVIDQDIGQILGFDPADCSHWKKGKKNVRSIQAMKSIAEHLGIDERLVIDVAAGDLDDAEAFYEFNGYGAFSIDPKAFDAAKKDFYRRHSATWSKDKEAEFKDASTINEAAVDQAVEAIHKRIGFSEAPLYLPEISAAFPELSLSPTEAEPNSDNNKSQTITINHRGAQTQVIYRQGSELKPFMRFQIAKALASHFLPDLRSKTDKIPEFTAHLIDVQSNLFAAKLLAPANLIRKEIAQVNVARDVVTQLAEAFWVSKAFMNMRLKDILQNAHAL
ncbi:MAG: ImmA/IrrE family metallo-endopeptidase [Proteobacteria bacterium]|nr:ImmA/IrrE family metallo-endopeptidase [Pseudomonadota bacterium]